MSEYIKGLNKLNKAISKELKPFGIKRAYCTDEYSYLRPDEEITYKVTQSSIEDAWFIEFIEKRFDYNVEYPFIISILHEIGHHKTDNFLSTEVDEFCENEKEKIDEEMQTANSERSYELCQRYYNLPDEILASRWAVNYARENPDKVEKMWQRAKTALFKFYAKNGIFDDLENIDLEIEWEEE